MPREICLSDLGASYQELEAGRSTQRRRYKSRDGRRAWQRIGPGEIRPEGQDWVYLHGLEPWDMVDHARAMMGVDPCPVCHDGELRLTSYCLACDRCGADAAIGDRWPGLPVSLSDRLDCPREYLVQPSHEPGELKGGK